MYNSLSDGLPDDGLVNVLYCYNWLDFCICANTAFVISFIYTFSDLVFHVMTT